MKGFASHKSKLGFAATLLAGWCAAFELALWLLLQQGEALRVCVQPLCIVFLLGLLELHQRPVGSEPYRRLSSHQVALAFGLPPFVLLCGDAALFFSINPWFNAQVVAVTLLFGIILIYGHELQHKFAEYQYRQQQTHRPLENVS